MLIEAGDCQPRSLAEAFRDACPSSVVEAERRASEHLAQFDAAYATGEARRVMSLRKASMPEAEQVTLPGLAQWAGSVMRTGTA